MNTVTAKIFNYVNFRGLYTKDDADSAELKSLPEPTKKQNMEFVLKLRKIEKEESIAKAIAFSMHTIQGINKKARWRYYCDCANLAHRNGFDIIAKLYYKDAILSDISKAAAWLEYACYEEEVGSCEKALRVVMEALIYNPRDESLLISAIKLSEKNNYIDQARAILRSFEGYGMPKAWLVFGEGAALEARQGNLKLAYDMYKHIIDHEPRFGGLYVDASIVAELNGDFKYAFKICNKGIDLNLHSKSLWFYTLKLYERIFSSKSTDISKSIFHVTPEECLKLLAELAERKIEKELLWKFSLELGKVYARLDNLHEARRCIEKASLTCPAKLEWNVSLTRSCIESLFGNYEIALSILGELNKKTIKRDKWLVSVYISRIHEFRGCLDISERFLYNAVKEYSSEWKVHQEYILFFVRTGNIEAALSSTKTALEINQTNGKFWSLLIQLSQHRSVDEQKDLFRCALAEVPKSGEVLCEGARIALLQGDYENTRRNLEYAIQFTPQYGDSFILFTALFAASKDYTSADVERLKQMALNADPKYGMLWTIMKLESYWLPSSVIDESLKFYTTVLTQEISKQKLQSTWHHRRHFICYRGMTLKEMSTKQKKLAIFVDE